MEQAAQRAIGVFFFLQGLCAASLVTRLPEIKADMQLGDAGMGFALSLMAAGGLAMLPAAGLAVTRWGSRRILVAAACCHAGLLPVLGHTHRWPALLLALVAFGMANTAVQIGVNAQAVRAERAVGRSMLAGYHGLWSIAGLCAALLGTATAAAHWGRGAHTWLVCGVAGVCVAWAAPHLAGEPPPETARSSGLGTARWRPSLALWRLAGLTFVAMVCESAMFDWNGVYFARHVTSDPRWAGLSLGAYMGAMAVGRLMADRYVSRLGMHRVLPTSGRLVALGYLLCAVWPQPAPALLGVAVVGLGVCAMVPLITAQAGQTPGMPVGVALAFVSTVGFCGAFVGPLAVGLVAEQTNLRLAFAAMGLVGMGFGTAAASVADGRVPPSAAQARKRGSLEPVT
jgi:MFS family permease